MYYSFFQSSFRKVLSTTCRKQKKRHTPRWMKRAYGIHNMM
nr:MAG TPA: hypothetical protein [Caudoviricetes sp.]